VPTNGNFISRGNVNEGVDDCRREDILREEEEEK